MTTLRSEAEIVTFRKLAQELAHGRKERATSVHLLAALASRPGPARELLRERRLDDEALLKAGRSFDETAPDAVARAIANARDLAKRSTGAAPGGLHVLLALLADRRSAAHRALEIAGVDLARLRAAAMQQAIGVIATRRVPPLAPPDRNAPASDRSPSSPSSSSTAARASARQLAAATPVVGGGRGPAPAAHPPPVAVPLFPQAPRRTRDEGRATPVPIAPPARTRVLPPAEPVPLPTVAIEAATVAESAAAAPRRPAARRAPAAPSLQEDELALDRARCPVLCSLGRNLTAAAAAGELDEVVARDAEIDRVLDVLAKRHAPSACLVGPAGVGKTAVARGVAAALLAQADATGTKPRLLVEIVSSELVAGTGARGALAERLAAIRAEVRGEGGRVVLFVDDVHELVGGGAADEATAELKLGLARGELTLLGATTPEEYKRSIESDAVLARRFTVVEIEEPTEDMAFAILRRVADGLAGHHGLAYPDDAVGAAIAWSARYLPGRALPDKAAAILDLAGARARRRPARDDSARRPGRRAPERALTMTDVAAVVSELADIPAERLLETDAARMLGLEALLAERVVGHTWAQSRIATVLRRNAAGLRGRRPIGTFLLLGPTGVGKTETAKAIAAALFHSPDAMTRLDLSEYAEPHAIARLVGAPPGYVGHESGGQLTEAVRRRPYQVVLLDEIEKAHRDVLEAFLQVFDEGRLTDGRGRRVDFTNTVLVLTSNLGAREAGAAEAARAVGFAAAAATSPASGERGREAMLAAARGELPPELWNRIDEVLCFSPLTRDEVAEIGRRLLDGLGATLEQKGVRLEVEEAAVRALLDGGGFDPTLGARPMRRAIMRRVEAPLAEMLLRGELPAGAVAVIGVSGDAGQVTIDAVLPANAASA